MDEFLSNMLDPLNIIPLFIIVAAAAVAIRPRRRIRTGIGESAVYELTRKQRWMVRVPLFATIAVMAYVILS